MPKGLAVFMGPSESESEPEPSVKDEVKADLEEAGLKVDDMDLFLSAIRRWCGSYEEEAEPEDPEDEGDDGLMGKMRK